MDSKEEGPNLRRVNCQMAMFKNVQKRERREICSIGSKYIYILIRTEQGKEGTSRPGHSMVVVGC